MPAGDLIEADDQLELRGVLMGAGTDWIITPPGVQGLGITVKSQDVDREHAAGVYSGRDYAGPRVLTFPMATTQDTAAEAGEAYVDLLEVWAGSETDLELHLRLPGFGHMSFLGRPRGLVENLNGLHGGAVEVLATFFCGTPTITYETGS
jgi:hypothetical protein